MFSKNLGDFEEDEKKDRALDDTESQGKELRLETYTLGMHSKIIAPALQMIHDGNTEKAKNFLRAKIGNVLRHPGWTREIFFNVLKSSTRGLDDNIRRDIFKIIAEIYAEARPAETKPSFHVWIQTLTCKN